ncbi:MAG: tetratricopeptide repeat protein [Luteolibacter sp.]|uniref:tetratricopeptide repeat protein n=1 Tax=Luteolibacter sp. TaxID=1962973 RepID=UPI0032678344
MTAAIIAIGFIGADCVRAAPEESSRLEAVPRLAEVAPADENTALAWRKLMSSADSALKEKKYAQAESHCAEALKIAAKLDPTDLHETNSLVLQAQIYLQEQRLDVAEQSLKAAVASCEKAVGTNAPGLVMPLENLGNFYGRVQQRFDLATPVFLRILDVVKKASPQDEAPLRRWSQAAGDIYRAQGQFARAESYYQQVLDHAGTNAADLSAIMLGMAGFYHDWGKSEQAEALCQRLLATREKAAETNSAAEEQINLAKALFGLAENYRQWGMRDRAETFYRRSLAITEKSVDEDHSDLGWPRVGLAALLAEAGKTNEAVALYQRAFAVADKNGPPDNPLLHSICKAYVALLKTMDRTSEADTIQQNFQWKSLMYDSMRAARGGKLDDARQIATEALNLSTAFGPTDTCRSKTQMLLGDIYRHQAKNDLAEQNYKEAVASCEKAVGTNHSDLILPLASLASFYYNVTTQYDKVVPVYQRIVDITQGAPTAAPVEVARWKRNLADVYHLLKKDAQAEALYQQALATVEAAANPPADEIVQQLQSLAEFYRSTSKYQEAEAAAKRALTIREQAVQTNPTPDALGNVAFCNDQLGQIYLAWNKPDQAESYYNQSVAMVEKIGGAEGHDLPPRLMGLAAALRAQKNYAAAETQYKRAMAILEKHVGPQGREMAGALDQYAMLLTDMQKTEEAGAARDRAGSIHKQIDALANRVGP